jgi:hypothetical protein
MRIGRDELPGGFRLLRVQLSLPGNDFEVLPDYLVAVEEVP